VWVALRRIGNGYPHWPPRSLSCSGADRPEAACGLDSADPAASLKGPGAVATVSSPLAIDALGRTSDTLTCKRSSPRRGGSFYARIGP